MIQKILHFALLHTGPDPGLAIEDKIAFPVSLTLQSQSAQSLNPRALIIRIFKLIFCDFWKVYNYFIIKYTYWHATLISSLLTGCPQSYCLHTEPQIPL